MNANHGYRNLDVIAFITIILPLYVFAGLFESKPLVQMPGSNSQISVCTRYGEPSYMAWINQTDTIYTLYVQRIYPEPGAPMQIQSTTNTLIDPGMEINPWGNGIKLIWSERYDNFWKLNYQSYLDDVWSPRMIIADSLQDSIISTAGIYRVCWTSSGYLYAVQLFTSPNDTTWQVPILIDSSGCYSPVIGPEEHTSHIKIVYEKVDNDSTRIKCASWLNYFGQWRYNTLSENRLNRYPRFGPGGALSFQTFQDSIWKVTYSMHGNLDYLVVTSNKMVNYRRPMRYIFPIPTKSQNTTLHDWLLVFDSDSLENNSEIIGILQPPYTSTNEMITISNLPGNDTWPYIANFESGDSTVVGIIWQHETADGSEIWWAKAPFKRIYGKVDWDHPYMSDFSLVQNYPNPFNSSTRISYQIPKQEKVYVVIYNLRGEFICNLFQGTQASGSYSIGWNTGDLQSGVYLIRMRAGEFEDVKKCLLLK